MRVRATKMGFYDNRRQREGSEFNLLDPKHFSEKWMERLDVAVPKAVNVAPGRIEKTAPARELI